MVYIVATFPRDALFTEVVKMLAGTLVRQGHPVDVLGDGEFEPRQLDPSRRMVLVGDGLLFQRTARRLQRHRFGGRTVLWQLEPFPPATGHRGVAAAAGPARRPSRLALGLERVAYERLRPVVPTGLRRRARRVQSRFMAGRVHHDLKDARRWQRIQWITDGIEQGWLDEVFTSSPDRAERLEHVGVRARFVPIGLHADMLPPRIASRPSRDLDVLFIGSLKDGRDVLLDEMAHELGREGARLHVERGPVFGDRRRALLARARISLCLGGPERELTRFRVVASIAAEAAVVAEDVDDIAPFEPHHLVLADRNDLAREAVSLLADETRRQAMTTDALEFLRQQVSMGQSARVLVDT